MASFLTLPVEVRTEIYKAVFDSIVLHFPKLAKDAGNETALLSVNRTTYKESRTLWFQRITFHFATPRHMLNKIGTLPFYDCARIQHIELIPRTSNIHLPSKRCLDRGFEDEILMDQFSISIFQALDSLQALQVES